MILAVLLLMDQLISAKQSLLVCCFSSIISRFKIRTSGIFYVVGCSSCEHIFKSSVFSLLKWYLLETAG